MFTVYWKTTWYVKHGKLRYPRERNFSKDFNDYNKAIEFLEKKQNHQGKAEVQVWMSKQKITK